MVDFFADYSAWFERTYGRPFGVTREEWNRWCRDKPARKMTDDEFDDQKERDGDW